jgi:hypothetical protein
MLVKSGMANCGCVYHAEDGIPCVHDTAAKTTGKYVILEGIHELNRFFSTHTPGTDPTKGANGETWYRILGFADTMAEAQIFLYGKSYTDSKE